jgi:hypothetical protein
MAKGIRSQNGGAIATVGEEITTVAAEVASAMPRYKDAMDIIRTIFGDLQRTYGH